MIANISESPKKPQLRIPLLFGQNEKLLIYQIQWELTFKQFQ